MKTAATVVSCGLILGLCAGGIWTLDHFKTEPEHVKPEVRPRVVRSQVVRTINKRIDVTTHGSVYPLREINLIAQVSGMVRTISPSLRNGGFFEANDVLVQLDDRDYKLEVTRTAAQVAQAKLRVIQEEAEAEIARREWQKLGRGKSTPLTLREPQVLEAKAGLAAAEATLAKAELALERTTIRAPFAGRVRAKSIDAGQFVSLGVVLARIYSIDFAEVRLPLHDSKLKYLDLPLSFRRNGSTEAKVTVTLRARFAQETQEWTGKIVRTEGEIDPRSRMIHAIARISDPYGRNGDRDRPPLSVGMFVEATIHGKTFDNVIEIPRDAVRDASDVFVIDAEHRMHRRAVRLLHRGEKTVIIEKGLEDGERICLSTIGVFIENMSVELEAGGTDGK